jgi:penicillin-binding protein 1A
LSGEPEKDTPVIEAVTLPAGSDATVRAGDVLPGVVLKVGPSEVIVAVKAGRGLLPRDGYAWVRAPELQREYQQRRSLTPRDLFQRGDVIDVRVVQVDPEGKAHTLALEQNPVVQGALLAVEAGTGHVLAMVGGYDFSKSQFNRAVQAVRQPGSAFKPVIYAAAIEAGLTPASIIVDAPMVLEGPGGAVWKPENYSQKFYGPTTLRTALAHSRNVVTVKLLEQIGIPAAVAYARRLGISSPLAPYLSLALGASDMTLLELTTAYGVFANGGMYVPPIFITKIVDAQGKVIEERFPEAHRVVEPEVSYVLTSMLEDVIQRGTGRPVRPLGRPAAGKTGTTNDFRDAWFLGFTPELITGVWIGLDDRTTLGSGEAGGRAASPIWLEFMQEAMHGQPVTDFAIPPGVRFVRIEAESGTPASVWSTAETLFEVFIENAEPFTAASATSNQRRNIRQLDRQRRTASTPPGRPPVEALGTPPVQAN